VSASADSTVRVWAHDLDDLTRDLTNDECRQSLHQSSCR
jgi:hypothetical protein